MILLDVREWWLNHEYKVMVPLLAVLGKLGWVRPLIRYIENLSIRAAILRLETIAMEKHKRILFQKAKLRENNFYYFPIYFASDDKLGKVIAKQFGKENGFECYGNKTEIMISKESFWKNRLVDGEYYM